MESIPVIQVHVLSSTGEDASSCVVHLINDGVVVNGYDVSIQFLGSRNVRSYLCKLDDDNFYPCERNRYEQLYIDYLYLLHPTSLPKRGIGTL